MQTLNGILFLIICYYLIKDSAKSEDPTNFAIFLTAIIASFLVGITQFVYGTSAIWAVIK
jgi:hypothetical protein